MKALLHKHEFRAMASPCEVVIAGVDDATARLLAERVNDEVVRLERKYSRYRDDSVVAAINRSAGSEPVKIDTETRHLLDVANRLQQVSGGLFDITAGVLRRVWRFTNPEVPTAEDVAALLPLIDWNGVECHGDSVRLPAPGMELDFGGFGKEYAADRAAQILRQAGVVSGYVNLGGDVNVLGPKPSGEPWLIGIQHPRSAGLIATLPVTQGGLATSGDYERYFVRDGQRYCHILNPRTGMPVRHWQSISVLAPNALLAGGFCTIAMLLEQEGLSFLRRSTLPFLAIDHTGRHWQHDEVDDPIPLRNAS